MNDRYVHTLEIDAYKSPLLLAKRSLEMRNLFNIQTQFQIVILLKIIIIEEQIKIHAKVPYHNFSRF